MEMIQDNPFEPAAQAPLQSTTHRVRFAGSGAEYFRIWIVNVALSLLTLGVYSAWAKVRRLNYFYRQTSLAGSSFEYHGQPISILKGRVLAVILILLWNVAPQIHPLFFAAVFVAGLIILPWLITSALRFRLHNSSYRGLRFRFTGSIKETARVFYLSALLSTISFGLAFPYLKWRTKRYFFDHAAYGSVQSTFSARLGSFFRLYVQAVFLASLLPIAIFIGLLVMFQGALNVGGDRMPFGSADMQKILVIAPAIFLAFIMYLGVFAFIRARTHVLCWDGLRFGEHGFRCHLNPWRYTAIAVRNLALTMLTLGLYKPFSDIQLATLLANAIELDCAGDFDNVVTRTQAEDRAGGEETAEFFDMDIGL